MFFFRTRNGRRERVKKKTRPSYVVRFFGKNRSKYTDKARNMKLAQKIYRQGEPGLLEKMGIIPNRRSNNSSVNNFACFGSYYRTRNGRREMVRNPRNRLRMKASRGKLKASARVSIPAREGEVYALTTGSVRRDKRNIKERLNARIGKRGLGVRAQGNLGNYQVRGRAYGGYNDG